MTFVTGPGWKRRRPGGVSFPAAERARREPERDERN